MSLPVASGLGYLTIPVPVPNNSWENLRLIPVPKSREGNSHSRFQTSGWDFLFLILKFGNGLGCSCSCFQCPKVIPARADMRHDFFWCSRKKVFIEAMLLQWWTSSTYDCIFWYITSLPEIYVILSYDIDNGKAYKRCQWWRNVNHGWKQASRRLPCLDLIECQTSTSSSNALQCPSAVIQGPGPFSHRGTFLFKDPAVDCPPG